MGKGQYFLTAGALEDYRAIILQSARKYGKAQAKRYRAQLRKGFERLAAESSRLQTAHRKALAEGTHFSLHLVQHHYVVYQPYRKNTVVIAALLSEVMDIPTRLMELQHMRAHEIALLKQEINA